MPTPLVYDLALSYAEAGAFEKAGALFRNRFFPREEGGTNVRQIWIRVRALDAQSKAARVRVRGRPRLDALSRRSDPASLVFAHADVARLQGLMPRQTGNASWNAAVAGLIEIQLGHTDKAIALLETALLLPDRNLSHHFSRVALAGIKR